MNKNMTDNETAAKKAAKPVKKKEESFRFYRTKVKEINRRFSRSIKSIFGKYKNK